MKLTDFCRPYKGCIVVYMITNPIGGAYVGVTNNLYKRLFQHCNSHRYKTRHSGLLSASVAKYGFEKHNVEILWLSNSSSVEHGYEMEHRFILEKNTWNKNNPNGLNLRNGNNDNSYLADTIRTCKPVHKYDINTGDFIASYPSSKAAALSVGLSNKSNVSTISDARDGKHRHAYGYFWHSEKLENYIPVKVDWITSRTPVYKANIHCTTIHERYETIQSAYKKNKVKRNDMFDAVENVKEIGGFYYLKAI